VNVLIIAYFSPPDQNGGVKRPLAFKSGLTSYGHKVFTLTHGTEDLEINGDTIRVADVHSFNGYLASFKKNLSRIYRRISLKLGCKVTYYRGWRNSALQNAEAIARYVKPDVIISSYPPIECVEIGLYISKKFNVKLIVDFRDPLVDESAEQNIIDHFPQMLSYFEKIDIDVMNYASQILVVAPSMLNYYETKGVGNKVSLLPNGFDTPLSFSNIAKKSSRFESSEKFIITYTGTLSYFDKDRSLAEFFSALMKGIKNKSSLFNKIEIHLYGNIVLRDVGNYSHLVSSGHVVLKGNVTMQEALIAQSKSHALLIVTGINRKCVSTGKIFEYIASGKPIIGLTKNTHAEQIINETGTGITISPRDESAIYDALCLIVSNFQVPYNPNLEVINGFSRSIQMAKLNSILLSIHE
jgi:glycosyltransferase involved in cell wall biosynthesis